MKNPWTKKNPFMSMWLSGANAAAGAARGRALGAAKAQTQAAVKQGIAGWMDLWTQALQPPGAAPAKRKGKPRRKGR